MPTTNISGSTPANGAVTNYTVSRAFKASSSIKVTSLTRPSGGYPGYDGDPNARIRIGLVNSAGTQVAVVEVPKKDLNKAISFGNAAGSYKIAARYLGGGLHGGPSADWAAVLTH
ncbi:hypothetical protein GCM10009768_14180 [Leucobacter iarius]|uniref:Uncharacterized protein n=2 Tax=Leucobacter iarius TaxID=333963 RepID=A0ABN2LFE0_9MICO